MYVLIMGETKISVNGFKCERCNYTWIPRSANQRPLICPDCKSARWDMKK